MGNCFGHESARLFSLSFACPRYATHFTLIPTDLSNFGTLLISELMNQFDWLVLMLNVSVFLMAVWQSVRIIISFDGVAFESSGEHSPQSMMYWVCLSQNVVANCVHCNWPDWYHFGIVVNYATTMTNTIHWRGQSWPISEDTFFQGQYVVECGLEKENCELNFFVRQMGEEHILVWWCVKQPLSVWCSVREKKASDKHLHPQNVHCHALAASEVRKKASKQWSWWATYVQSWKWMDWGTPTSLIRLVVSNKNASASTTPISLGEQFCTTENGLEKTDRGHYNRCLVTAFAYHCLIKLQDCFGQSYSFTRHMKRSFTAMPSSCEQLNSIRTIASILAFSHVPAENEGKLGLVLGM